MTTTKRPVRIANASGFYGDRGSAFAEMVAGVDVLTADYLAEVTMMILAKQRLKDPSRGYAATFLRHLEPVLATVLEQGTKVVVNAGGLDPEGLARAVTALGERLGLAPKVAWLSGDDLTKDLPGLRERNGDFPNLETGDPLPSAAGFVYTANAYLGAWGIVRALEDGADIVVCPRVTDASLVVGAAAWWHGWERTDFDRLAGAVAAGHVIECGPQATGGNYSSFLALGSPERPGFPLAEVADDGSSVITKQQGQPGAVTVGTVTAQLVYEVGSARYLNPDVVTHLDTIALERVGEDRVALTGVRGSAPPPTTKVAITCKGQQRSEMTLAFVGLDIDEKIALFERTTRAAVKRYPVELAFQRIGSAAPDAPTQDEATVLLRVVATGEDPRVLGGVGAALIEQALSSYPGFFAMDLPKPPSEAGGYWPTLVAQRDLEVRCTLPDGSEVSIEPPPESAQVQEASAPSVDAFTLGETERGPLGRLVDARSGDKGSHANVGLWVRHERAYPWLVQTLTVDRLREILPEARDLEIERHLLPNLLAVNFVIHDLLSGGAVAAIRFDRQAKALGEFIRSRFTDLPTALLSLELAL